MKILTWNIQATKGCDDRFDSSRIIDHIKQFGELDVICLQEVSKHIPDLNADDQPSLIAAHFPGFQVIWAPGFSAQDAASRRYEFGNLTLVRSSLLHNSRVHSLPSPQVNTQQIPRTMAEVMVAEGEQLIAIFNTHLAFHSGDERIEQIQALTKLRDQTISKSAAAITAESWGPYKYVNSCEAVILCGDLNVDSDSDEFRENVCEQGWVDCWTVQRHLSEDEKVIRPPTCGCFDHVQWPQGPHVKDYFLSSANIAQKIIRVDVDVETDASDHQPVFMEIDFRSL